MPEKMRAAVDENKTVGELMEEGITLVLEKGLGLGAGGNTCS